jgi:hypothetical protein
VTTWTRDITNLAENILKVIATFLAVLALYKKPKRWGKVGSLLTNVHKALSKFATSTLEIGVYIKKPVAGTMP